MTTINTIYDIPNIGCLLGTAYQAELSRLNTALAESGLGITATEYLILRILYAYGPMQQCELSRILCKDKGAVSRSIRVLISKELVTVSKISYKCNVVSLTDKGEIFKAQILKIAEQQHRALKQLLSPGQMENLREILNLIINKKEL